MYRYRNKYLDDLKNRIENGGNLIYTEKFIQDFYKFRDNHEKLDAGFDLNDLSPEEKEF